MRIPVEKQHQKGSDFTVSKIVKVRKYWENELSESDHAELAEFLRSTYGALGNWNADQFPGNRSWAGARPELRLIGYDEHGVVVHMGLLRRMVRIGEVDQLICDMGLYAVRPDAQRSGIGTAGFQEIYPTLHELKVPFGFGTVRFGIREHFEPFTKVSSMTLMDGVRVRSADEKEFTRTCIEEHLVVLLPIEQDITQWPTGEIIDRNGLPL